MTSDATVKVQAAVISELRAEIQALTAGGGALSNVVPLDSQLPVNLDDHLDDDSTFNFRLNTVLKKEFFDICKRQHLTVGSALKRYMTDCVRIGTLK